MRKRIIELKIGNETFKKTAQIFPRSGLEKYEFIEEQRAEFPVKQLCGVPRVSEDAFYAWHKGKTFRLSEIGRSGQRGFLFTSRRLYGARRISAEYTAESLAVDRFDYK